MTSLHAALAEPIRQSLVETLGDDTSVRVVAVENTIGLHVLRDFPYPCCTYSFQPKGSQRRICFDIHMELAACIVGRTIGRGDEIRVVDVGQIGRDEFNVISPVAGRLMREIVALWSEVVDMDIIEPEVETSNVYLDRLRRPHVPRPLRGDLGRPCQPHQPVLPGAIPGRRPGATAG